MICKKCAYEISDSATFCPYCGEKVEAYREPVAPQPAPVDYNTSADFGASKHNNTGYNTAPQYSAPQPQSYQQTGYQPAPQQPYFAPQQPQIPNEYKPLSPWAYFGYNLLFAIPVIGLICLIVFSISSSNINRRNFARSFWCLIVIGIIIGVILGLTGALTMGGIAYSF